MMTAINPKHLSTKERLGEVCAILAAGIVRLHRHEQEFASRESALALHISPAESGGVGDDRSPE